MPKIDLLQGSQEWHDYRKDHIMATDCAIIMDVNPWKDKCKLWREKQGLDEPEPMNDAMRRGQLLEPEARKLFVENTGIEMEPCVWESDQYPWMSASLDGISSCGKYILEIKCMSEKNHKEAIQGLIKEYYCYQMWHQLICTDAIMVYYLSYRPEFTENPFALTELILDREKKDIILKKEYDFWLRLCNFQEPEKPFQLKLR